MSRRTETLGSTIQKELAQIIMHELHDPASHGPAQHHPRKRQPGFSVADVYVTIMGTPGQQSAALERVAALGRAHADPPDQSR